MPPGRVAATTCTVGHAEAQPPARTLLLDAAASLAADGGPHGHPGLRCLHQDAAASPAADGGNQEHPGLRCLHQGTGGVLNVCDELMLLDVCWEACLAPASEAWVWPRRSGSCSYPVLLLRT